MSNRPVGHDEWTLWDAERENARHFDDRPEAESKQAELSDLADLKLFPPGESPEALYHAEGNPETDTTPTNVDAESQGSTAEDGGNEIPSAEDVSIPSSVDPDAPPVGGDDAKDLTAESTDAEPVDAEVIDHAPDAPDSDAELADFPERNVSEDPLKWMPGEFVDEIDGSQAINRKGFEVLGHFYDIDVHSEVVVAPEDTDHEYCRVEAVAETPDGRRVESHGSAHIDRGDDHFLLLEMADTRARKRALSIATGAGAVAVEELQNEVDR